LTERLRGATAAVELAPSKPSLCLLRPSYRPTTATGSPACTKKSPRRSGANRRRLSEPRRTATRPHLLAPLTYCKSLPKTPKLKTSGNEWSAPNSSSSSSVPSSLPLSSSYSPAPQKNTATSATPNSTLPLPRHTYGSSTAPLNAFAPAATLSFITSSPTCSANSTLHPNSQRHNPTPPNGNLCSTTRRHNRNRTKKHTHPNSHPHQPTHQTPPPRAGGDGSPGYVANNTRHLTPPAPSARPAALLSEIFDAHRRPVVPFRCNRITTLCPSTHATPRLSPSRCPARWHSKSNAPARPSSAAAPNSCARRCATTSAKRPASPSSPRHPPNSAP
jgi:hypothetical protein